MQQAYRQHLITRSISDGRFYVSRDGAHLCSYASLELAKRDIDALLAPAAELYLAD